MVCLKFGKAKIGSKSWETPFINRGGEKRKGSALEFGKEDYFFFFFQNLLGGKWLQLYKLFMLLFVFFFVSLI